MKRLTFLLCLAFVLLATALPAWAAPDVSMTAQLANQGRIRPGSWATVLVDLANQGAEVSGEVVVRLTQGPWDSRPEFVVPLTLPAGGKKRVPVTIPLQGGGEITVTFKSGGAVLEEQTLPLNMQISPDAVLIGVLSDDELGIPGLAQLTQKGGGSPVFTARLDPASLPTRAALVQDFDVIALSRFDTATLTQEQLRALEIWVGKGGTLLLTGGPEWRRTLAPLPKSLVPVEVTGTGAASLTPLADLVGKPITGNAPISQAKVLRGRTLAADGDIPLLVQDQVGAGQVVYLAADPGLNPMATWQGQGDLFQRFLNTGNRSMQYEWGGLDGRVQYSLRRIPSLGLPPLWIIGLVLGGYMLLIGPINYFILKRIDRREWTWVSVPALSVLFVATIWLVGFGTRAAMVSHLITVTELSPGTNSATMTSYVGVYAPSRTSLAVGVEDANLVRPIYVWGGGQQSELTTRVIAGEKTTVEMMGMNNYSMRGFAMEHDLAYKGGLELVEAKVDDQGGLTTRVINKLEQTITDLRVTVNNQTIMVGTLEPGQTSEEVSFRLPDMALDPKLRFEMMQRGGFENANWNDIDQVRRNEVAQAVVYPNYDRTMVNGVKISGFIEQPLTQPKLPDLGRLFQGTNLVHVTLPLPVDPDSGDVPPGLVKGIVTSGQNWHQSPMGYVFTQGEYTVAMTLPPLDAARVADVKIHFVRIEGGVYTLAVKNQQTGEWVELKQEPVQSLPGNWQEFVGAGGTIELKTSTSTHLELVVPTVSVKGVAR